MDVVCNEIHDRIRKCNFENYESGILGFGKHIINF